MITAIIVLTFPIDVPDTQHFDAPVFIGPEEQLGTGEKLANASIVIDMGARHQWFQSRERIQPGVLGAGYYFVHFASLLHENENAHKIIFVCTNNVHETEIYWDYFSQDSRSL